MCPGKMRNLAPACLNGLSTAYLRGGISAVSAQRVEQEHKYRVWIHLWTQYPPRMQHMCFSDFTHPAVKCFEDVLVQTWGKNICSSLQLAANVLPACAFWTVVLKSFCWETHKDMQTFLPLSKSPDAAAAAAACVLYILTSHKGKDNSWHACPVPPSPLDFYYVADVWE